MPVLQNTRQELFCQNLFQGMTQTDAAIKAGYSLINASCIASRLVIKSHVAARLQELKGDSANVNILSVSQRKELLSQFATEKHVTQAGITRKDNISAISELNKMERIYDTSLTYKDNRSYTINVTSPKAKAQLQKIINGEARLLEQGNEDPQS